MRKKLIVIVMLFLFSLTNVIYADDNTDNSNIGSVSEKYGTIYHDTATLDMWTSQSDISIARIGLYNGETKELIDRFIVSNYSFDDLKEIRLVSTMTKTEYIDLNKQITDKIEEKLSTKSKYLYIPHIVHIPDFPQLIIKNTENVYNNVKTYFNDTNKVKHLMNTFNIDYNNVSNIVLLVEPMGIFQVNRCGYNIYKDEMEAIEDTTLLLLSSAEIGLLSYNDHPIFKTILFGRESLTLSTEFQSFYYKQLYQAIPFSCYKVDIEKLRQIKPYTENVYGWNVVSKTADLSMIDSLGCFEIYSNIGGALAATPSVATRSEPIEERRVASSDIKYYTNTYVISNVNVSSVMGFPRQSYTPMTNQDLDAKNGCLNNRLAEITYRFESTEDLGTEYYTQKIAIPKNGSAISWVKWKTPRYPCKVTMRIASNNSDATLSYNEIEYEIIDPMDKYPPNTEATDRNDSFIAPNTADGEWIIGNQTELSWSTYTYSWHYYWVYGCSRTMENGNLTEWGLTQNWDDDYICEAHHCPADSENHTCPTGRCHSVTQDWGWVEWQEIKHTAKLDISNVDLRRSEGSPDTNNSNYSIKSGYGVELTLDTYIENRKDGAKQSINSSSNEIVPPQVMEMFLPEYDYEEYNIVSIKDLEHRYQASNYFELPTNPYSQFEQKCHFTPIWFPDGNYVVGIRVHECFCPAGMLYKCFNNITININGNVYDDWHIAPKMN